MQGLFKVIREGEIAKDIILLCSLALFCFVLFLFYFCCCCCCWCRLTVFPLSALMIKIKVRYYYSNCMFKGCYLSYNLNSKDILWQASVKYCNEIWKSLDWIGKNKESLKETNQCKGKGYGRIESPSFLLKPSSNIFQKVQPFLSHRNRIWWLQLEYLVITFSTMFVLRKLSSLILFLLFTLFTSLPIFIKFVS